ncbi:MAG: hypothetical protein JST22_05715 [Bacteroidetes bacterium]|nr:hypothetical protein [Bacteroidota bacterium]
MKKILVPAVLLTLVFITGCRDSPTGPTTVYVHDTVYSCPHMNLLDAGDFLTSNPSVVDMDQSTIPPWLPATGTPQLGAGLGCDSTHGYIQMWGNSVDGESIMQHLRTPIQKGKTYVVTACIRFLKDNPANVSPFTRVRFMAFNQAPSTTHWVEDRPNVAVIGSVTTSNETWQTYTLQDWVADSDYSGFAFNVEDDLVGDGSASWAKIDNVTLKEK